MWLDPERLHLFDVELGRPAHAGERRPGDPAPAGRPGSVEPLAQPRDHLVAPLVGAEQHVAIVGDPQVGVGLGPLADQVRLARGSRRRARTRPGTSLGDLVAVEGSPSPWISRKPQASTPSASSA